MRTRDKLCTGTWDVEFGEEERIAALTRSSRGAGDGVCSHDWDVGLDRSHGARSVLHQLIRWCSNGCFVSRRDVSTGEQGGGLFQANQSEVSRPPQVLLRELGADPAVAPLPGLLAHRELPELSPESKGGHRVQSGKPRVLSGCDREQVHTWVFAQFIGLAFGMPGQAVLGGLWHALLASLAPLLPNVTFRISIRIG
jgi:hypothetical protein